MGLIAAKIISGGYKVEPQVGLLIVTLAFTCFFIPSSMFWSERAIGWGIPAFLIVLYTAAMEPSLAKILPKWVGFWGDSSYALYLFHSFYVPVVGAVLVKLGMGHEWLAFSLAVAGSIAVGAFVHQWIELPLGRRLKAMRSAPQRTRQRPANASV
jgi:exopolysaccharide production protein ExoZ